MKKIFSIIAIAVTLISVVYMMKIDGETEINNITIENHDTKNVKNKNSMNKEKSKEQTNSIKDKNEASENKEIKKNDEADKSINIDENKENNNIKTQDDDNNATSSKTEEQEKTATVFKVDKNTIASRVSFEDKAKLLIYSRSLSTADEAQIKELMKSSDELNASIKIFKLLKMRLDTQDYNSVKSILSPYVDVNLIEKNIK